MAGNILRGVSLSLLFLEQNRFPSDLRIHRDRIGPMVYMVWTPIGDELYDISGLPQFVVAYKINDDEVCLIDFIMIDYE